MKKLLIFIVVFSNLALAMEMPPSRKRAADEPEEQQPAKVAFVEPTAQEQSAFEALPNEVKRHILEYLLSARGDTADIRLAVAAQNIRNFMKLGLQNATFRTFLEDENLHGYLITQLAKRYAGGNIGKAALALRTDAGGRWLARQPQNRIIIDLVPFFLDAVNNNDINAVSYLLQYGGGLQLILAARGPNQTSALMSAAGRGDIAMVEKLLQVLLQAPAANYLNYMNKQNAQGISALMIAASNGHAAIVERLLAVPEIDVNKQDLKGFTALMIAAYNGRIAIVERLLAVPGLDVNKHNFERATALILAAQKGYAALAERLLAVPGLDVNKQNSQGFTALMLAAYKGDLEIVKKLLAVPGINVNVRNLSRKTALGAAQESQSPNKNAIIKLLKDSGAIE